MTGKTHRILGIGAGLSYAIFALPIHYSPATLSTVLVGSYFASLIPDLDRSTAEIWNSVPLGKTFGKIVDPFIKHRNISHSALGLVIFSLIIFIIIKSFPDYWAINKNLTFWSLIIAYSSHLLADMLTVDGVPLLYPHKGRFGIPPKPFQGIRILTGKWFENLVIFPLLNMSFVVIIITQWDKIKRIIYK